jgi:hypothetical protein
MHRNLPPDKCAAANRRHAFPLRACQDIRFWVAQATGLCRPATRRAERGACTEAITTGLLKEAASIFRSASRRPERASRPCYPIFGRALISRGCD